MSLTTPNTSKSTKPSSQSTPTWTSRTTVPITYSTLNLLTSRNCTMKFMNRISSNEYRQMKFRMNCTFTIIEIKNCRRSWMKQIRGIYRSTTLRRQKSLRMSRCSWRKKKKRNKKTGGYSVKNKVNLKQSWKCINMKTFSRGSSQSNKLKENRKVV